MTNPMTKTHDRVTLYRDFACPPNRLWRALSSGALLAEWLMPNDFQPIKGHRFQFRVPPMPHWDGVVSAEVVQITPETHLAIAWDTGDLQTLLTFTLIPLATGVRLQFEQSGFRGDQLQNRNGAAYGWPRNLDRLESLLATEI